MPRLARAGFLGLCTFLMLWAGVALAQPNSVVLRISTENEQDHVQTRAIARFIAQLKLRAGDAISVEFYPEAQLFRDRDVIRALEQGRVEMALPGIWQFDRFVPDVGLFFLPMMYGQDEIHIDKIRDGETGAIVDRRIEGTLDVKVLGRWIDLGPAQLFTMKKPVRNIGALPGLVIRTPGGEASALRLAAQGARPVTVPWPDLPSALQKGHLDGLVTTFETAASASLWRHGIAYAFEDRAYFAQYIPLVSEPFWNRLSPSLKKIMQEAWEANVGPSRVAASQAQSQARSIMTAHGLTIQEPSPEERAKARQYLLLQQPGMIKALGIDPALAEQAMRTLEGPP